MSHAQKRFSFAVAMTMVAAVLAALALSSRADASHNPGVPTFTVNSSPTVVEAGVPTNISFTVNNTAHWTLIRTLSIHAPSGVSVSGFSNPHWFSSAIWPGNSGTVSLTATIAECSDTVYSFGATASGPFGFIWLSFAREGGSTAITAPCPPEDTTTTSSSTTTTSTTTTSTTTTTTTTSTTTTTTMPTTTTTSTTSTTLVLGPQPASVTTTTVLGPSGGWDETSFCLGNTCETDVHELGATIGKLSGDGNAVVLFISLRPSAEVPDFCGDDFESKSEALFFNVWGYEAEKVVEMTIADLGGEADDYEVCYAGEDPFDQEDGDPAVFALGLWWGILPDCENDEGNGWPGPEFAFWDDDLALGDGNYGPAPCVAWREVDETTDDLTVIVLAPPGDPLIRVG